MKKLLLLFVLLYSVSKSQPSCNQSSFTPTNIFYPGPVTNFTSAVGYSLEYHYLCKGAVVYDTTDSGNRIVLIDSGAIYTHQPSGTSVDAVYIKKGGTLSYIQPIVWGARYIIYEPGAIFIDPFGVLPATATGITYTCTFITFPPLNCFAGVEENSKSNLVFSSWPNPANNSLHLEIINSQSEFIDLKIINQLGETVLDLPKWDVSKKEIALGNLTNGVYYLNVRSGRNTEVKKIVVLK